MNRKEFVNKYSKKIQVSDGLYISCDGIHFILSTERENGLHWLSLDSSAIDKLIEYRKDLYKEANTVK